MIKRLDRLEIATSDLDAAAATYRRNFGFEVRMSSQGGSATIAIGGAEIRLQSVASVTPSEEGMAALWLEAENVDQVAAALERAGIKLVPIRRENGRRVLALDPAVSSRVPLFIFDRRA